jgi:hypothetical protein
MRYVKVIEKKTGQKAMHRHIEQPTIEQRSKGEYINLDKPDAIVRKKYSCKLEEYYYRKIITEEQYHAGIRLAEDAHYGCVANGIRGVDPTRALMPRTKGYRPSGLNDKQMLAYLRWSKAYFCERLGNNDRDILDWVCIEDRSLSSFDGNKGYARGALLVALNELGRYYKHPG